MTTSEPVEALKGKVKETIEKIPPPIEKNMIDNKNEIWDEPSRLYYKYETNDKKESFREIMKEISEKVNEDKWDIYYQKFYGRDKT